MFWNKFWRPAKSEGRANLTYKEREREGSCGLLAVRTANGNGPRLPTERNLADLSGAFLIFQDVR